MRRPLRGRTRRPTSRLCALRDRDAGDRLHLTDAGEPAQRVELDLADALPCQPEAAADLLERPRLGAVEAVAQREHLALARGQPEQRVVQRLAPEIELDA